MEVEKRKIAPMPDRGLSRLISHIVDPPIMDSDDLRDAFQKETARQLARLKDFSDSKDCHVR